jgi:16S rRNA processing protein RimM
MFFYTSGVYSTLKKGVNMENLLRVGVISSTHGIKGEVKVFPTTDDMDRFRKLKKVILDTGKEQINLEIENVKFFKQFAILKFKGFDNINDIEKYKGKDLLVTRDNAVPLKEHEFFICDLIGCMAYEEDGTEIGELTEVMQTGANDVFIFKTNENTEILVPYTEECIKSIDIENKKLVVYLLPGLV